MVDGPSGNGALHEAAEASAVNEGELRALEAEATVLLARMQFMRQAGVSFKGYRDLYEVLGYDRDITTEQYRDRYERGGIAGTIVDVMVDATWRGGMELIEDEDPEVDTAFEGAWQELEERLNLTTYMIRADRLSRLSDYAVMLIGTSLNGDLAIELPKGKPEHFIFLQPYSGGGGPARDSRHQTPSSDVRARVESYDKEPNSKRYGKPATYSLRLDDGMWASNVHHSRIVHVAEGCLDDDVFGRSILKRCWNLMDDLDKVTGGGAEAFWLRANQGTHLNIDKDMALQPGEFADVVTKLKAQSELYKHQQTRWLQTRGVDVKTLGSDVANFASPADAVLKQISGATRIPTRILTGSEMGELASSQDRENFKDQINGRQEQHAGPNIVRKLADRLIEYGYLPSPAAGPRKYFVKFAHIQTKTEQEKNTGAKDWAAVNQAYGSVVFTDSEIREEVGKAPLSDEQKQEIADAAEEKVAQAQAMMVATTPEEEEEPKRFPRAASEAEMADTLRALEQAIEDDDFGSVARIIGLTDGPYKYGTTQVQLPPDVAAKLFAISIDDSDIYELEGGRETDAHVTVKYGLLDADPIAVSNVVSGYGPVSFTFGKTNMFAAPDYDVVFVEVQSADLGSLRAAITKGVPCKESDHGAYRPHATVAYVKPGMGSKYTGLDALDGVVVTADVIVMSDADGERTEVSLA